MNQIATYRGPRLPTISRALSGAIGHEAEVVFGPRETAAEKAAREMRGDSCPSMVIRVGQRDVSGAVVAEARRILPDLERAMEPCPDDMVRVYAEQFVEMIAASVANIPDEKTINLRIAALCMGCAGLPEMAFSQDALRACITKFKFFPSVHEIMEVLTEQLAPMRERIARTRVISRTTPREDIPERRAPTDEERRAVAEQMEAERSRRAAQIEREEAERKFGMWTLSGHEDATGEDLIAVLKNALPTLEGWHRTITEERIEILERAQAFVRSISVSETRTNPERSMVS